MLFNNSSIRTLLRKPTNNAMKFYLIITGFLILGLSSCQPIKYGTPPCIKVKIGEFESQCCDKGANVKEYDFKEEKVYVFDPGTCGADMTSEVFNEECVSLGYLGGITGNNTILGEDFSNAKFNKTCWEK